MDKNLNWKIGAFAMGLGLGTIVSIITVPLLMIIMDSYRSSVPYLAVMIRHIFFISGVITTCLVTVAYATRLSKKYKFQFKPLNYAIISICLFVALSSKMMIIMSFGLGKPELFLVDFAVILLLLFFVKRWEDKIWNSKNEDY